jgi:hypothetical protein
MIKSKFIFSILIAILLLPQSAFAGFKFQSGKMVRADISVNESEMVKNGFRNVSE